MFYMDTSALVAYYCPEPLSETVDSFITTHKEIALSALTELELFSAVARKIREGGLALDDGTRITAKFLSHLDGGLYTMLPLHAHHFRQARDWIGRFATPLRTLDALHLALVSSEGATLVTTDKGLVKSARLLAVDVLLLNHK